MSAAEDDPRVQALLREAPVRRAQPFTRRERVVHGSFAAALLAAVVAMGFAFSDRHASLPAALLLLGIAITTFRVRFTIGAYTGSPVQLATVPTLLLLPPALAVVVLAAAWMLGFLHACLRGRLHRDRVLVAIADQWYVAGGALVLGLWAPATPQLSAWPVYLAALVALLGVDAITALARLWLAEGVSPDIQLRTSALVFAVDAALAPLGLLAAFAGHANVLAGPPGPPPIRPPPPPRPP